MQYIAISEDESLYLMLEGFDLPPGGVRLLVGDRNCQRRLQRRGVEVTSGRLDRPGTYRRLSLEAGDLAIIHLHDGARACEVIAAIERAQEHLAFLVFVEGGGDEVARRYPEVNVVPFPGLLRDPLEGEIGRTLVAGSVRELEEILAEPERVLILLQDDPDPDAIASGLALRTLLGRTKVNAPLGSFGAVTRPENLAMVRMLEIEIEPLTAEDLPSYEAIALVDVQPDYFGDLLPRVDAVIDHHPEQRGYTARFRDIRASYGATSTILTEYLRARRVNIPQRLATALLYGIKSDTLSLNREVSRADIEAFAFLYPLVNYNVLRRIERPQIPIEVIRSYGLALQDLEVQDRVAFAHVGRVEREDVIPQLADFCLQVEGVEWSVVSGIANGNLVISLRNVGYVRSAGELVRSAFAGLGSGGGHRSMAKVVIPLMEFRRRFGEPSRERVREVIPRHLMEALREEG